MSDATSIEWTDATWNPTRGCTRVSPGCVNCYAERTAARQMHSGYAGLVRSTPLGPRWTGKIRLVDEALDVPLRWRKPRRIFVNSMSDLFHEDLPDESVDRVFARMIAAGRHTFQILTKRAERMRAYVASRLDGAAWSAAFNASRSCKAASPYTRGVSEGWWPRYSRNVWLGVSVEDQQRAEERIPLLLATPAAVRFLSVEPLLGPVDLLPWLMPLHPDDQPRGIGWVIVGGESGPGARPCDVEWIRSVVRQCREAGVACFVKQLGASVWSGGGITAVPMASRKGGDPSEWPEDLRVREFPKEAK